MFLYVGGLQLNYDKHFNLARIVTLRLQIYITRKHITQLCLDTVYSFTKWFETQVYLFFLVIFLYLSFTEMTNLIKNLVSLNYQYLPENTRTKLPDNRPFALSGYMVRNKLCWDTSYAVGLPKQRNLYQLSPTFPFFLKSQCVIVTCVPA